MTCPLHSRNTFALWTHCQHPAIAFRRSPPFAFVHRRTWSVVCACIYRPALRRRSIPLCPSGRRPLRWSRRTLFKSKYSHPAIHPASPSRSPPEPFRPPPPAGVVVQERIVHEGKRPDPIPAPARMRWMTDESFYYLAAAAWLRQVAAATAA